jgi:signal transduction histidine kinase
MSVVAAGTDPLFSAALGVTLLAAVVSWGVAVWAWRHRPAAGARALTALTAATGWWALGYVFELLATDVGTKLVLAKLQWIGVLFGPVAWVTFALSYTGRDRYTTLESLAGLSLLPFVGVLAVWTNPSHHLMWTSTWTVASPGDALVLLKHDWGVLYWALLGYGYLLWLAGAGMLVRMALDLPSVYRLQAGTLVLGAVLPLVGNLATTALELAGAALDVTPATFAGAGLACTVALRRYDLLEARPVPQWIARERVLAEMADAVVVTDTRWDVTELNDAAVTLFEDDSETLRGRAVEDLLPGFVPPGDDADPPVVETVTLSTAGVERHYELRASDFTDHHGRLIGHAIVLRDVTDRRHYLQRLEVMNRVLRHNLRTEANLLHGYADLVVSELDAGNVETARQHADRVQESAFDLAEISEKARKLDDVVDGERGDGERETAPVVDQLRAAIEEVTTEYPDANVRLGALPDPDVECSMTVVPVVRELVENAVEHTPDETPRVVVWGGVDDGTLVVRVADEGPGIHPQEVEAIRAAVETPLHHGSGLGLWLVTWGVNQLGGTVSFDDRDGGGTVVTLRIPAATPA